MAFAKDEVLGLVIATLIGGSALGLYGSRQLAGPRRDGATAGGDAEAEPAIDERATPAAREAFAEALEVAFVNDGTDAAVAATGTKLEITWFPCSKAMLGRLVRKQQDALTRKVREASGLSLATLRAHGFTEVVCDNTRGVRSSDTLGPGKRR
ncbi:MAG: hypothetical protein M3680_12720 [Myxococcota bacterium]|nr:hypothetical protein [Myxococcota bacterium]